MVVSITKISIGNRELAGGLLVSSRVRSSLEGKGAYVVMRATFDFCKSYTRKKDLGSRYGFG